MVFLVDSRRGAASRMKKKITATTFAKLITISFFVSIPLIAAALFCLKDGKAINDVYIPLGGWSDEITYYKQIEGILSYGLPRGYFGYNQSKALYGPFGVWGIIPLIPYVIWGFLFGWNYTSPIYANIFFCMLALFILYLLIHPKKNWMIIFSIFWICNQFLNRYLLSGVIEASIIAQLLTVTALGTYLLSDVIRHESRQAHPLSDGTALVLCTLLICFMSLERPYFEVLFLIPLWKAIKDRRKTWIALLPIIAIVTLALFFLNNHYFCSTYFTNIFSAQSILDGGFSGIIYRIFSNMIEIARLIWYAVRYKGMGVGWYYLLLFLELFSMIVVCVYRLLTHRKLPPMYLITLIGNVLILLSLIIMYDLGVGARHILALIVANSITLIIETRLPVNALLALVCCFSIIQTGSADAIPYRNDDYANYMIQLKEEFSKVVSVSDDISYDNVVAMPTADSSASNPGQSVCTYYGLMFAMPSGVGISLDFEDFYETPENIKAGYILVHPDGTIREKLESWGMHRVYQNDELMLYAR